MRKERRSQEESGGGVVCSAPSRRQDICGSRERSTLDKNNFLCLPVILGNVGYCLGCLGEIFAKCLGSLGVIWALLAGVSYM